MIAINEDETRAKICAPTEVELIDCPSCQKPGVIIGNAYCSECGVQIDWFKNITEISINEDEINPACCFECGTDTIECPKCKGELVVNANYCGDCGVKVNWFTNVKPTPGRGLFGLGFDPDTFVEDMERREE